jgi:hypothetical protein
MKVQWEKQSGPLLVSSFTLVSAKTRKRGADDDQSDPHRRVYRRPPSWRCSRRKLRQAHSSRGSNRPRRDILTTCSEPLRKPSAKEPTH